MVDVTVRVEQARDRPLAAVLPVQRQRRRRRLARDQRVDHQHPLVPLDDRHVRKIEAPHLVNPVRDLEEAVDRVQLTLPPQAGVHRRRAVAVEELVGVGIPHDPPIGRADDAIRKPPEASAPRIVEVLRVIEAEVQPCSLVRASDIWLRFGGRAAGHPRLQRIGSILAA